MATLLPLPETTWIDQNGVPLAGGSVYFYIPNTTTPKDTYKDAAGTVLNTNPVILDSAGRAIVYGTGSYRQEVYDAAGNLIWDQVTADTAVGGLAWGGVSTGTPNAQVIAASSFSQQDGQQISFTVGASLTNTGPTTVSPGGASGIAVLKDTLTGPTSLTGGELVAGNTVTLIYSSTNGNFQLASYPIQIIPPAHTVTNAMLAQAPANTLKGNNATATADETDLTTAQVRVMPGITLSGYLFGLTLANDTTTPATVLDIAAGEAASSNAGPTILSLASAFTKKINTAWASGTGNGALATGSAFGVVLHIYIIGGPTVTTDILASNAATNPVLPTGYTLFRRIGSVIINSGTTILAFLQTNDDFYLVNPASDFSGSQSSATLTSITVPSGIRVLGYFSISSSSTTNNSVITIADGTNSNISVGVAQGTGGASGGSGSAPAQQYTNTSAQIYVQTGGSGPTGAVVTLGWRDTRGRM